MEDFFSSSICSVSSYVINNNLIERDDLFSGFSIMEAAVEDINQSQEDEDSQHLWLWWWPYRHRLAYHYLHKGLSPSWININKYFWWEEIFNSAVWSKQVHENGFRLVVGIIVPRWIIVSRSTTKSLLSGVINDDFLIDIWSP